LLTSLILPALTKLALSDFKDKLTKLKLLLIIMFFEKPLVLNLVKFSGVSGKLTTLSPLLLKSKDFLVKRLPRRDVFAFFKNSVL